VIIRLAETEEGEIEELKVDRRVFTLATGMPAVFVISSDIEPFDLRFSYSAPVMSSQPFD